jgi:hypothetical protein
MMMLDLLAEILQYIVSGSKMCPGMRVREESREFAP